MIRSVSESVYVSEARWTMQAITSEILLLSVGYSEFGLCPLSNAESGYIARSIPPAPARPSLHTLLQPGVLPDLDAMIEEQYCSSMQALNRIAGVQDDPSIAALNHPDVSEVIRQFAKSLPPKESVSPPVPSVDYFISVLVGPSRRGEGCVCVCVDRGRCCYKSAFACDLALADGCSTPRPRRKREQQPRAALTGEATGNSDHD